MMRRCLFIAMLGLLGAAAPQASPWTANATDGSTLSVPAKDRVSVILFVRADQKQSQDALAQAQKILAAYPVQAFVVLNGSPGADQIDQITKAQHWTGPVVLDPDYTTSGNLGVHVWPTTVVIDARGQQVAHLAGMSLSYAKELDAQVAFAAGKIDQATRDQRLASNGLVSDTPDHAAGRHLQVARRLLDKGMLTQARAELEEGLKLNPSHAPLQLALADVLLRQNQPADAIATIEKLPASSAPAWQLHLIRGRALRAMNQLDPAKDELQQALKLNPAPAPAQYELGLIYQQQSNWQAAAEAFRAAYEAATQKANASAQ